MGAFEFVGMSKRFIKHTALGVGVLAVTVLAWSRYTAPSLTTHDEVRSEEQSTPPQWVWREGNGGARASDPRIRCAAAMLVDNRAGAVIYARNERETRPIASLTKLLTSLVFLESGADLHNVVAITEEDAKESSRSRLRPNDQYTLDDLLHAALMSSDNRAARALSRSAGIPQAMFIARMNDKARALGMDSTHVIEPTGLSTENVSTAYDCAILVNAALKNPVIREITSTQKYMIQAFNRRRPLQLGNTNRLLDTDLHFVGAKTGFIVAAGWCVAARAVSPEGDDVTAIVLGAPSSGQRFRSLANALHWAFDLPRSRDSRP